MVNQIGLLLGEHSRSLDQRYRLSLPSDFVDGLADGESGEVECLLAKERPGCLSLWNHQQWSKKINEGIALVRGKIQAGRLDDRVTDVQALGRLLSSRHRQVPLAGRGRLVVPESFRQILGVEPGGEVMLVGAAICVEIWNPATWAEAIGEQMPEFRSLFDRLTS